MSETLKVNTTLTELFLSGEEEKERREGKKKREDERISGNGIGDKGAKALSEMLKVNKTLKTLELGS